MDKRNIIVVGEVNNGNIHHVTYELTSKAAELGERINGYVEVLLLGYSINKEHIKRLFETGADKAIIIDNEKLGLLNDDYFVANIRKVLERENPYIVLTGATPQGRAIIPKLAIKLHAGLTADCTDLDIEAETDLLLQTRPAFGGNLMATIKTPEHTPQMSTVRPKVFKINENYNKKENIENIEFEETNSLIRIIEMIKSEEDNVNLADADIVVSGGRGVGNKENFSIIYDFAKKINGVVGASRAAIDAGWIPYPHQVGQTGQTVSPKLYFAIGISGAIQHQVGMKSSDYIVAINKDTNAPIFNIADYGIVGDLFEIVPKLIKLLD
ncbi:electron transfer flavoprotein subunit alpha/FixB family protein [bacterium]|nr:electron transfer flavoprotein subunit alpha/FixB family protein [bacterium]